MIDLPLKSITLNLGNVHIYDTNLELTKQLLSGTTGIRFTLNTGVVNENQNQRA